MTYEQAERRLREIVNGSHGDQPLDILLKTDTEDFEAVANCILDEVKALKEDLETADKTLKKECKKISLKKRPLMQRNFMRTFARK